MMFQNNFKIAFRSLMRRGTFTAINITGLMLGMTAAIFAFLWVQNEMSFDNYHQQADNIYRINTDLKIANGDTWQWAVSPLSLVESIKRDVPEVAQTASFYENRYRPFTLQKDQKMLRGKRYNYVSENWFDLFDHTFIDGSADGFHHQLQNAIITRAFAERLFDDIEVAGETFFMNEEMFTVQAVIENLPANSSFSYEMVLPLNHFLANPADKESAYSWNNYNFLSFVALNEASNTANIGKKITDIIHQRATDDEDNQTIILQPLSAVHFDESRVNKAMLTGNKTTTFVIAFIGFIALLLACINYVSLTTAQAGMRTKEVGVRKIIGARGGHIFRLLFSESLITAIISLMILLKKPLSYLLRI